MYYLTHDSKDHQVYIGTNDSDVDDIVEEIEDGAIFWAPQSKLTYVRVGGAWLKYGATLRAIEQSLTHAVVDNDESSIYDYQSYTCTVVPEDGYSYLSSYSITMGSSAIDDYITYIKDDNDHVIEIDIDIPHVNGDIDITVTAAA